MATKTTTKKKAPARTAKKVPAKNATAKKAPSTKTAEATTKPKAARAGGKLSAIDAAAKVLTDTGEPMNCKELIEVMAAKKLWTSPGGKTPDRTLYSAILREIGTKGKEARFEKTERGKFAANG